MQRWSVVVLAFALGAASCGGGSGEDGEALASAIADVMTEDAADSPFTREEAECFGTGVVDAMGTERLVSVGLSIEDIEQGADPGSVDLTDDDVTKMMDALEECVDFGQMVVDEIAADLDMSDSSTECLIDGINGADFLQSFARVALIGGGTDSAVEDDMTSLLFSLIAECLTADELSGLGG